MAATRPDTVYFTFGRFNPPTIGHAAMIETLIAKAKGHKPQADAIVFPSATQDKKKNPLQTRNKVHYLKEMFAGRDDVEVLDPTATGVKTPFAAISYLKDRGYTELHFVVGSDRVPEFRESLAKYHPDVHVESGGERNMNSNGTNVAAMKATTVREAVQRGNWNTFRRGVHPAIRGDEYEELFYKILYGLEGGGTPPPQNNRNKRRSTTRTRVTNRSRSRSPATTRRSKATSSKAASSKAASFVRKR